VDTQFFKPGTKATTPLIVYFGGMRRYKRADHALRAFALLRATDTNVRFVVVGSGPELPKLMTLAEDLNLRPAISFLGRVDRLRLSQVLSQAWVNIHCSTAEGWGLSLLEAAASGVPTVAYRVPGLIESVAEGVSGLLVNDGNPEALATGVTGILPKIREWTAACREYSERFNWDAAASAWLAHLRELVG
jgi:glycosyltransferase involved in cell wall biosynthesis